MLEIIVANQCGMIFSKKFRCLGPQNCMKIFFEYISVLHIDHKLRDS